MQRGVTSSAGISREDVDQADDTGNPERNYLKCDSCRQDRKPCKQHVTDFRCQRCVDKNRPCGTRVRKAGNGPSGEGPVSEYAATIMAAQVLLHYCRLQNLQIFGTIFPWPCFNVYDQSPAFRSRSWSLSGALQSVASRLWFQMCSFDAVWRKLLESRYSIWTGTFINELRSNLTYYPDGSVQATSFANARTISACFEHIPDDGGPPRSNSLHDALLLPLRIQRYQKIEVNVRHLLECEFFQIAVLSAANIHPVVWPQCAFPASHIAYWNGDKEAAFALWLQARWNTDILGRTFAHIVAEGDDLATLQEIRRVEVAQNIAYSILRDSATDTRGLTVLAILVCKGHAECFDLLLQMRPQRRLENVMEPRLLDLALASGNKHIIDQLVWYGYATPPFTHDVKKIIELGRADLSDSLLDALFRAESSSQWEVNKLAKKAEKKLAEINRDLRNVLYLGWEQRAVELDQRRSSMSDLLLQLRTRRVRWSTRQEGISSLVGLHFEPGGHFS